MIGAGYRRPSQYRPPTRQDIEAMVDQVSGGQPKRPAPPKQPNGAGIVEEIIKGISGGSGGSELWGGLPASEPVATGIDGGTILADGTVSGLAPGWLPPAAAAAAILYGGKTAYDFAKGKKLSPLQKAAFALPTAGLSLVSDSLQKHVLGDKNRFQEEFKRADKLRKKGIKWDINTEMPSKGRSKSELIKIEQDKIDRGQYGNTKFAQSRDEKDLQAEDIWGYSAFGEKYGNDWLGKFSEQERRDKANAALKAGAVREHKGQIDIDWDKVDSVNKAAQEQASAQTEKPEIVDPGRYSGNAPNMSTDTSNLIHRFKTKDGKNISDLAAKFEEAFKRR